MLSLSLPDPGRWPVPGPAPTTLAHCVLLALLLHLLLVLLVGNVPGGSARPGQGVWGSINVTLRSGGTEKPTEPPAPELPPGPTGRGDAPRWGGAVRERAPEESIAPGAARVGEWAERAPGAATTPAETSAAPSTAPSTAPSIETSTALSTSTPAAPPAPTPPAADPPAPTPAPLPPALRSLDAPAMPSPAALPALVATPAPVTPVATPAAVSPELLPAVPAWRSLQAVPAPTAAPAPLGPLAPVERAAAPALAVPALPMPTGAAVVPPAERQFGATLPAAPSAPSAPVAPLGRVAPLVASPALPALAPTPALAAPVAAPTPAATATASPAPAPAPAPARATATAPPAESTTAATAATASTPMPAAAPVPAAAPMPASPTASPDAGPRIGHDQAVTPSTAASMPRVNLALPRLRGGELSIAPARGALPMLPRPPEVKSKLEGELHKAGKPDCRDKYAGMGVLALVPLAAEAVRADSSCRW